MTGFGIITFEKQSEYLQYFGFLKNSNFQGEGRLEWKNGRVLEGEFWNGFPVEKD